MPEQGKPLSPRQSQKSKVVSQILDHIRENYQASLASPLLLMWRETINGYHQKLNPDLLTWARDSENAVHEHWKQFGKPVVQLLRKDFTVVTVGHQIRELIDHGKNPTLGGKRTTEFYASCLPSSSNRTLGMVLFPRDSAREDHPLIVLSRERGCLRGAASLANAVDRVRDANDLGNLADETRGRVLEATKARAVNAFDPRYPLFQDGEQSTTPARA